MSKEIDNVLLTAHDLTHGERRDAYSHPYNDYSKVVGIFQAITGITLTPAQGSLFMVSVKLARLDTNDKKNLIHLDSVVDAAGYLWCYAQIAEKMERTVS